MSLPALIILLFLSIVCITLLFLKKMFLQSFSEFVYPWGQYFVVGFQLCQQTSQLDSVLTNTHSPMLYSQLPLYTVAIPMLLLKNWEWGRCEKEEQITHTGFPRQEGKRWLNFSQMDNFLIICIDFLSVLLLLPLHLMRSCLASDSLTIVVSRCF